MAHTITVPDEMWAWAEEQSKLRGEGPATYLRAIIIGAMVQQPNKPKPHQYQVYPKPSSINNINGGPKAKSAIVDVLEGRKSDAHGCKAILTANDWDWVDPTGMMKKDPEEVQDFLQCCAYEVGMFADMFASRRNLLKMIFDAYMRAHGGYRE